MRKEARTQLYIVLVFLLFSFIILFSFSLRTIATSSFLEGDINLTIWDDTDTGLIKTSGSNIYFYANFTNITSSKAISDGNCTIRFENYTNSYGGWENMTFNSTLSSFVYNRTFNYKGTYNFNVNCSNASIFMNLTDFFNITNTAPSISMRSGGTWIDFDGNPATPDTWQCTEDTSCYYNFTANITEVDVNDVLSYNVGVNTTLTNYTLNETTGMLLINITHNDFTGTGKKIELKVKDNNPDALWQSGLLEVDVTPVNDAPIFSNLQNQTFNRSVLFEYIINVTDEEDDIPFTFNITFINCSTAEWSDRNNTNCTLFNESQYSTNSTLGIINISFIPSRNDVGDYIINFTVTDLNNTVTPYNASTSMIVNFSVLNVNSAPYFTYICDNERNSTEDKEFNCYINATDIDETSNLTFSSNYTWFLNNNITSCNITTAYNASAFINFTATDLIVGNWSINITVTDTGNPLGINSTIIWFYIGNINDSVSLQDIGNFTGYTGNSYTITFYANDDDLLIPDKGIYDENLTFSVKNLSGGDISWLSLRYGSTSQNTTTGYLDFTATSDIIGLHTVNVSVIDANNYSSDFKVFTINISGNSPPQWNSTLNSSYNLTEDKEFHLNLSEYVTDADGDTISFNYINLSYFPSFSLNETTGVINFTPIDEDVGLHKVWLNATDNKKANLTLVNFTITNINDAPYIATPLSVDNATIDINSNVNVTEDNRTTIILNIYDNDFKIPSSQKSYYNENLSVNLTIQGPNPALFSFIADSGFPVPGGNLSVYNAVFLPQKADVGSYNITINVTDLSNSSISLTFNLTVFEINHAPVLMSLENQTSTINRTFYVDINATDVEDGNDTEGNLTFSYEFLNGTDFINNDETIFNSTSGILNITFNSTYVGIHRINITVNDSQGLENSDDFWIYVYDSPSINFPDISHEFHLFENNASNLTFTVNHTIGDNLTYIFYIENETKYNVSYFGNNTNLTWQFTPNFTDETYGRVENLTLFVFNPTYPDMNATRNWSIIINHTNAPPVFSGYIGDKQATYSNDITINLASYFSDIDFSDVAYNQSINFTVASNVSTSQISWSVSGWTLTLSSSTAVTELLNITANDSEYSATSNSFTVEFTTPTTTPTPVPTSGGGGATQPVSLKIIVPDPISAYRKDKIIVPIKLVNDGRTDLYDINLTSLVVKNMTIRKDVFVSFDKFYFKSLLKGKEKNVTLTVIINTNDTGLYEITINASVKRPKYFDWGKLYLTVKELNKTEVLKKLIFTEELIAENPECIEIKEIVKEARKYFDNKNYVKALEKANEAVEACKYAISQQALPILRESPAENELYKYLSIVTLVTLVVGIGYYIYRKIRMKRAYKF